MSGLVIAASCLLGGGSRAGFLGDVVTQLLAVPLLMLGLRNWSVRMAIDTRMRSVNILLHAAMLAFIVLLLVQLVPLTFLPAVLSSEMSRLSNVSLTPAASWAAAISSLPFFAVLLGVGQIEEQDRTKLTLLVMVLGALALLIGFIQVLQGADSDLRFFEFTNPSEAVGFFANRNHFAAQLYTTLVFAGIWFATSASALLTARRFGSYATLRSVGLALLVVAVLTGLAIARSRAGVLLSIGAIIGIAGIFISGRYKASRGNHDNARGIQRLVLSGLAFALLFAAQFGLHHLLTRFELDPLDDYRVILSPATVEIALNSAPFGTGLGSFPAVYGSSEKLEHLFSGYANRAHNDWAEFLLEAGIFGVAIGALFLAWFGLRTVQLWRQKSVQRSDLHLMLQRGGSLIILLLLAHSLVDYPLRTTAMSVVFAFACALLVPSPAALARCAAET
jgi:O-antigen ligase